MAGHEGNVMDSTVDGTVGTTAEPGSAMGKTMDDDELDDAVGGSGGVSSLVVGDTVVDGGV